MRACERSSCTFLRCVSHPFVYTAISMLRRLQRDHRCRGIRVNVGCGQVARTLLAALVHTTEYSKFY